MNAEQQKVFDNDYMPYIIKWGKITCWLSIPLIFIPVLALAIFYGAAPSIGGIMTGLIALVSAMVAWYVVDPITLFPILHVPGMYLTYIAGNSKEIRAPAATSALSSADVQAGTPQGTVISCIAISTSIFISIAVMTLVAIAGQFILSLLPSAVISSLNYLLPALFGAMLVQRIMMDYKTSAIIIPAAFFFRWCTLQGFFSWLPRGGGYAQILLCVIAGTIAARKVHAKIINQSK